MLIRKPSWNRSVEIRGSDTDTLSSDGGALIARALLDLTNFVTRLAAGLTDNREAHRCKYSLEDLLTQWLTLLMQGWGSQRDAKDLQADPAIKVATSSKRGTAAYTEKPGLASQSTFSRLLTMLSSERNREFLSRMVTTLGIEHLLTRNEGRRRKTVTMDIDGIPIDTYGAQQGSGYNGYYKRTVYQGLIAVCGATGDILGGLLCPGSQQLVTRSSAFAKKIGRQLLKHVADRVIVRADAGFNDGKLYKALEKAGLDYIIRLKKNNAVCTLAEEHLQSGWSDVYQYFEIRYKAKSWNRTRRVVMVIPPHTNTLIPSYFLLLTSLSATEYSGEKLYLHYSKRGKAEKHFGELNAVCPLALSSSPRPRKAQSGVPHGEPKPAEGGVSANNAALFTVNLLAYNLLHVGRSTLQVPDRPYMSLPIFRKKYFKVGVRLVRHARYLRFYVPRSTIRRWQRYWARFDLMRWEIIPDRC